MDGGRGSAAEIDRRELEYQYSPSKWSKRMDPEEVIGAHVKVCGAASQRARESIPHRTLRYGKGKNQEIDIFGTLKTDSQLLVYVHGGYWQELDRTISAYVVEPLVQNGICAAIVGYDLAPDVKLDRIVEEMQELDTFLTRWSADNGVKGIWYAGHSAGAHLIASILKNRGEKEIWTNFTAGMIFISGVYDLSPLVDTYVNDKLGLTRDEARALSVTKINLKTCQNLKLLVAVAENDSSEFIEQSRRFHGMLAGDNPQAEYMMIKDRDHFDVVEKLNDDQYELTRKILCMITKNVN